MSPGEALAKLFLDNADHGRNAANDELVAALRQRAREIQALADLPSDREDEVLSGKRVSAAVSDNGDDPELTATMRRAEAVGFQFTRPKLGAAWWGQRHTARWRDVVFLDPSGPCNACRSTTPGSLFAERVSGDALTVLRTVCEDWPI